LNRLYLNEYLIKQEDIKMSDVNLVDFVREKLGIRSQSVEHFFDGTDELPCLGEGLAVNRNGPVDTWTISEEDAEKFVREIENYWEECV